jgi:hypothetical protein
MRFIIIQINQNKFSFLDNIKYLFLNIPVFMQKDDDIVVFETYYNPMLAQIVLARLEANGIPGFITDESLGVLYPVYNQGGGGIKLKVFARDLEKCREIVAEEPGLSEGDPEQ